MSVYFDKNLLGGRWRATYDYCGKKYRIPGLFLSRDEAMSAWVDVDRRLDRAEKFGGTEGRVYEFIKISRRKDFEKAGLDVNEIRLDEQFDFTEMERGYFEGDRKPGIMYETYLYERVCGELFGWNEVK